MPDAVKATGDRDHRIEEGIGKPDGENRVLLAQGLGGADAAAVMRAQQTAESELKRTAQKAAKEAAKAQAE